MERLGTESDATELLDELVVRAGSGSDPDVGRADVLRRRGSSGRSWVLLRTGMSLTGQDLPAQQPYFFKSEFFNRPPPP